MLDAGSGEIVASLLTGTDVGEPSAVPDLLGHVDGPIASVSADGAYDGDPVYHTVTQLAPDRQPAVVIPPRTTAVACIVDSGAPSQRDRHIRFVNDHGRIAWQKADANKGGGSRWRTDLMRVRHL